MFEIQSLLDASGAGWTLIAVSAINNAGQIVGTGIHNGQARAFLLTPLPESNTLQTTARLLTTAS